jgi:DNA-nicking Smr family endonuclease
MNLNDIIFINNLPTIDLHGLDRSTARVYINDFINDNLKMKKEFIVIVHGIGSHILRDTTHQTLKCNKNVLEYKLFYNNVGCTIAKININKTI